MENSTVKAPRVKPAKPSPDYPLFAHPSGQWARKIRGRLVYFGVWADPDAALLKHDKAFPYLARGLAVPDTEANAGPTLRKLANKFLEAKRRELEMGDLAQGTWTGYHQTCERLIKAFGREAEVNAIGPERWADYRADLSRKGPSKKALAPTSVTVELAKIKAIWSWGKDHRNQLGGVVIEQFGPDFIVPSKKAMLRHANEGGDNCFERAEILRILEACDPQMRVMVLMALNCGFGNADLASLPESALDLEAGWVRFPRVKTGIARRVPLWDETKEALAAWLPRRPRPTVTEAKGRVFLMAKGLPWVRDQQKSNLAEGETRGPESVVHVDRLSPLFKHLLSRLKINGRRRLGFYTLRHTFATQAGECLDPVAVSIIMGHTDSSMTRKYQHAISDERLKAVTTKVHDWLWPPATSPAPKLVRTIRGVAPVAPKAVGGES